MMQRKYPNLCKPIKIGNVTFRNRMFSAPMGGTDITADCTIGRASTAFYELRAKGGLMRVREFTMKDSYSLDMDSEQIGSGIPKSSQVPSGFRDH